ncbi:hypothetical protein [Ensifer sp. YR511]|uniref:hypothetical protein n=1 Tax=Ensifer sp. YR511 TaxID=1855294 RepID=UPI00115FC14B|nr:hypothetical protein [Ensifer sp. YR511]
MALNELSNNRALYLVDALFGLARPPATDYLGKAPPLSTIGCETLFADRQCYSAIANGKGTA